MRQLILSIALLTSALCSAQFSFSGFTNPEEDNNSVYLSLVEDYRKLTGVYSEQIIAQTTTDAYGYFEFTGNMLDSEHRIYRIHTDKCQDHQDNTNYFNGYCETSEELLFIAKNTDTLKLPFSFGKQVFCDINSSNPKADVLKRIDSLKEDMRFAYSEYRSEANRKLNDKKWFSTLQDFGEAQNEPIAELYIYAYLSDRSSDFHNYYVEDLRSNAYYDNLKSRLEETYPESNYTKQYINELEADRYMLSISKGNSTMNWGIILYVLLICSLGLNTLLVYHIWNRKQRKTKNLKDKLSKQEQIVLEHLLQNKSNKAIAEALFLSVSTVKSHTNNIYKKLNVQSRDEVKSLFIK